MSKKILLASGCSYTDSAFKSFDPDAVVNWPMWPEIVANKMNLKCLNVGKSGESNYFIFNSLYDEILLNNENIDTVMVLWTGADRSPFYANTLIPTVEIGIEEMMKENGGVDLLSWMDDIGIGKVSQKYFKNRYFPALLTYKKWIDDTLRNISLLLDICELYGIKLIMKQGVQYFPKELINGYVKSGLMAPHAGIKTATFTHLHVKNPYFKKIIPHRKKFIGWPIIPELGGFNLDGLSERKSYRISEKDHHPNAMGQEFIADMFLNRYYEVYGRF